jgi:hypothetical protein
MPSYPPSSVGFFRLSPMAKLQLGHTKKSNPPSPIARVILMKILTRLVVMHEGQCGVAPGRERVGRSGLAMGV